MNQSEARRAYVMSKNSAKAIADREADKAKAQKAAAKKAAKEAKEE